MRLRLMLGIGATLRATGKVSAQINAEDRVKAASLHKCAKFLSWRPDAWSGAGDPSTVCALETSPSGGALDEVVEGKKVPGQLLCRRQIQAPGPPQLARSFLPATRRAGPFSRSCTRCADAASCQSVNVPGSRIGASPSSPQSMADSCVLRSTWPRSMNRR